jgi:transcriptional regulator with XRE-family HTH domain
VSAWSWSASNCTALSDISQIGDAISGTANFAELSSLYVPCAEWQCGSVNELRELRRDVDLSQRDLAKLLDVPVNTVRMWDSGLRRPPARLVARACEPLKRGAKRHELLPLDLLAKQLGVYIRTLRAAARTGRLEARFSVRSVFRRPIRFASRAARRRTVPCHAL